jgi:hypothetical protein
MATVSFRYYPDNSDNEGAMSATSLAATVEYSVDVPNHLAMSLEDLEFHFHEWTRSLGYQPD